MGYFAVSYANKSVYFSRVAVMAVMQRCAVAAALPHDSGASSSHFSSLSDKFAVFYPIVFHSFEFL